MGNVFEPPSPPTPSVSPTPFPTTLPTVSNAPTEPSWLVGPAFDHGVRQGDNVFEGLLTIGHDIGWNVKQNHTKVELYDLNCVNKKNSTGLAIFLGDLGSNLGFGNRFFYDLGVDQTKIGDNVGGFITFQQTDSFGSSVGTASCCTRVSTYESQTHHGMMEVFFRETNFVINFNMTQNEFNVGSISINDTMPDAFVTDVTAGYSVLAYQCNNFTALPTPHSISQNENVVVCLEPYHPDRPAIVHISNFNLQISSGTTNTPGYVVYNPVAFGSSAWVEDKLTNVHVSGKIVMISAPIVAEFFLKGKTSIDITGNAFLEFDSAKGGEQIMSNFFATKIGLIEGVAQEGCFITLLRRILTL